MPSLAAAPCAPEIFRLLCARTASMRVRSEKFTGSDSWLIKFRREEMFSLYPLETFVFCNRRDLGWTTHCFWSRDRKTNKSFGGFHHKSRQIDRVLDRCSGQNQSFVDVRDKLSRGFCHLLHTHPKGIRSRLGYCS